AMRVSFGGAGASNGWNFFEGNTCLLGDGARATQRRRMGEPFLPPLAPMRRHHVELGKLEESGDGGARIAGGGDGAGVGCVVEAPRQEVGKSVDDEKNQRVTKDRIVVQK